MIKKAPPNSSNLGLQELEGDSCRLLGTRGGHLVAPLETCFSLNHPSLDSVVVELGRLTLTREPGCLGGFQWDPDLPLTTLGPPPSASRRLKFIVSGTEITTHFPEPR